MTLKTYIKPTLILACALLAGCVTAHDVPAANTEAAPVSIVTRSAEPAPRSDLSYLEGLWRVEATDPRSGETVAVNYRVEPVLGGRWLAGSAEGLAAGVEARDMWGRDLASGEIIRIIFDGSGVHGIVRSPGWRGDTLVLEGVTAASSGAIPVRETITRLGPGEFRAVWEARLNGVWTTYSVEKAVRT